jgi:flavodoxin I
MKVGVFYGSTTGNTRRAAEQIRAALRPLVTVFKDIRETTPADIMACEGLILGASTWEEGALQEHWKDFLPELEKLDLSGKTVALFGLGDQEGYSGRFQDAMGTLYRVVTQRGANVVGRCPTDEYRYHTSYAIVDGEFVGLPLDDDTQKELTPERIQRWTRQIRPFFE